MRIEPGSKWVNIKNGSIYKVVNLAIDVTRNRDVAMVAYVPEDNPEDMMWVRELEEFSNKFLPHHP